MVTERSKTQDAKDASETPEIMTKPLPQIMREMEANVKAAAEASKKAEEAAMAARGAAGSATTVSLEVAQRIAEVAKVINEATDENTLKRIEAMENRLKTIEDIFPKQKTIVLKEISKEEAKSEIEKLFKRGKILYYSDIAEKLRIDLELVVEICEELVKEGRVKIADGSR